jgi:hypothetical protein
MTRQQLQVGLIPTAAGTAGVARQKQQVRACDADIDPTQGHSIQSFPYIPPIRYSEEINTY